MSVRKPALQVGLDEEVRLHLIQTAAELPSVRAGVDLEAQIVRTIQAAEVWYNWIKGAEPENQQKRRRGQP